MALRISEAGKPSPAASPAPASRSPPAWPPMQGWGLCRGPARSAAEPAAQARAPRPKVRRVPPSRVSAGQGRRRAAVCWPPHSPLTPRPSPFPPLPPGGRRRLRGPPSALPAAAAVSPVPAPPSAAGRTSGARGSPAEVSGDGSTRTESHGVPGTPSRPRIFRRREGVKLGDELERGGMRGSRVRSNPKLRAELLSPLRGLPQLLCPWASGVERMRGGGDRAAPGMPRARRGGRGHRAGAEFGTFLGGPNIVTMASE